MDEQRQDDQLGPTYNSSVPIQDVEMNTYRKWWTIEKGGWRGLGRSILMARHDDDDRHDVIVFVISLFVSPKMAPVRTESTWGKYGAFLNSFHPKVKRLIRRLEWIKDRIGRRELSVLLNQTLLQEKILPICIYTFICVCMCVYLYIVNLK